MPRVVIAALAALLSLSHVEARAQAYPSKPIRFVIPFGAGSATDALARIIGQDLEQTLGQPIIVAQKPGADGALAAGEVKRAAPDGYTLLFGTNSPLAVAPNMQKEPPYNVLTDFTPITFLGENSFFLVVHPSVPANSLAELIAVAKASPKPLNYAAGNTYAFVSMAMLAKRNKIELEAIRYKSEPDAIADLLSGRVQVMNGTMMRTGLSGYCACAAPAVSSEAASARKVRRFIIAARSRSPSGRSSRWRADPSCRPQAPPAWMTSA